MTTLIKPDSDLFKKFFDDCTIVMSAPNVFFLVGEHAVLRGIPSVVQAMPTRVYVGIKPRESSDRWLVSNTCDGDGALCDTQVKEEDPTLVGIGHLRSFTEAYYAERTEILPNLLRQIEHLAIKVLSDITPGSGANWSGAFSSALAGCVHLGILENVSDPCEISNDLEHWGDENRRRANDRYDDINLLAFFLESAFHGGQASGYGNVISLLGSPTPVLYRTHRRFLDRGPYVNVYTSIDSPLDGNRGTKMVISRLRNIAANVQVAPLCSDFLHLVYIAVIDTLTRKEIGTAGAIRKLLNELLDDLRIAGNEVPRELDLDGWEFSLQPDDIWSAFDNEIVAFIHFFYHFLRTGNPKLLSRAISYMNAVSHILLAFGLGWEELMGISAKLLTAPGINQSNTAIKLSGGGTAGVCTVMSSVLNHRALMQLLEESDCILYSSDLEYRISGLTLHKLGGAYR